MPIKKDPPSIEVEWDAAKERKNRRDHGVSFSDAATVFDDPMMATIDDPDHSLTERRMVTMGHTANGRLLVVVHTNRGDKIRLISARRPTRNERRAYENA